MANPSWLDQYFARPSQGDTVTLAGNPDDISKGDILTIHTDGTSYIKAISANLTDDRFPVCMVLARTGATATVAGGGVMSTDVTGLTVSTASTYVRLNITTGRAERIVGDPSSSDWPIGKAFPGGALLLNFQGTNGQLISDAPLSIDFTSLAASYIGATISRTASSVYLMRTASTVAEVSGANLPLYEDRGDGLGGGLWTFPAYTNGLTAPFDMSDAAWVPYVTGTVTANALTAPNGAATADQFSDANAGAGPGALYQSFGAAPAWTSVWVTDNGVTPTHPGMLAASSGGSVGVSYAGTGWKRVSQYYVATDIFALWGPGKAPGPVDTAAATGTYYWWGASYIAGGMDLPLAATTSGAATIAIDPARVILDGDFDVEFSFVIHHLPTTTWAADFHIFQGTSTEGDLSLRYVNATNRLVLAVRGVDVLTVLPSDAPNTNTFLNWAQEDTVTIRAWYRPGAATAGVRYTVNGVTGVDKTGTTTGVGLASLTAFSLGAIGGTPIAARFRNFRVNSSAPATKPVEFLVLGDSTIAAYSLCGSAAQYYSASQRTSRTGIGLVALPGDTIALQKAKLLASPWYGYAGISAIVVQVGINDCTGTSVNATVIAAYQDLISTIRTGFPSAKIVVSKMSPAATYYTAVYGGPGGANAYATWQALNNAIASTITGPDARVTSHDALLNDGSGNLVGGYSIGDGVHTNNAGRAVVAAAHRTALVSLGVL